MQLRQTVSELARLVDGRVEGDGDPERRLAELLPLERAGADDLAAVFRARYLDRAAASAAGCLLISEGLEFEDTERRLLLRVADAEAALDTIAGALGAPDDAPPPGVHPSAVVDATAVIEEGAGLGPFVSVGPGARVGAGARLWPGVVVGRDAVVGAGARLRPHVVVGHDCRVGERTTLHAGVVVGADGFGFRAGPDGRILKSPQVGTVEIGPDCEIGANTTIDRARLDVTVIGPGCKFDDHVHIGHNARIGAGCAIAAGTLVAGSVVIEDGVLLSGNVSVLDGVRIASGTQVLGHSYVAKDTAPGEVLAGIPARPRRAWAKQVLSLQRLPDVIAAMKARAQDADLEPGHGS